MLYKYLFRIILLGHPGVGKSSLLAVLTNGDMSLFHKPTIGIDELTTAYLNLDIRMETIDNLLDYTKKRLKRNNA